MQRAAWAAVLAFAVAAVPARGWAQTAEPATAAAPTAGSTETQAAPAEVKAEKKEASAEEENNAFRHTGLVKTIAKAIHLDVETTARIFEFLNFAIVALAVIIPLVRSMPKILRKRSQTLKHDLETARKVSAEAGQRLSAIEAQLAGLDQEIAKIRTQMESESKQDEARIKASIGEESNRIVAAAEQEIAAAAAHAQRELRGFAVEQAVEQAARQLVLTPETDRALIAEFVSEAGRNGAAGGGRN